MTIIEQLEQLAEEELCHECHTLLTDEEKEYGYVCKKCVDSWCEEAYHGHTRHWSDELGL